MTAFLPTRTFLLSIVGLLLLGLGHPLSAQPTVDNFDLVLVGSNLSPESHRISLKTNPTQGENWTPLTGSNRALQCEPTEGVLVIPDLSVEKYVGQDIRENHLSLKITTDQPDSEGSLRAVYALPSVEDLNDDTCSRLHHLIQSEPSTIRTHSLASLVRPRPVSLEAGTPFIDHVEVPVRHHKPGVMEVEWLEILFREGNS